MNLTRKEAWRLESLLINQQSPFYATALVQVKSGLIAWERRHRVCRDICDLGHETCSADMVVI